VPEKTDSRDAVARLLQAWRGEVQARAMYTILAARMGDQRRAGIVRAIAEAEGSHRQRIERRLTELGQPIPDPSSVGLSVIQRLQARLAPVETVIERMEAAEEEEDDRAEQAGPHPRPREVASHRRGVDLGRDLWGQ
jgi:rubrerythrin